jgi:hypothetical protein
MSHDPWVRRLKCMLSFIHRKKKRDKDYLCKYKDHLTYESQIKRMEYGSKGSGQCADLRGS